METPEGKSMVAVPFTVSFVTWVEEEYANSLRSGWQEVVALGTAEMLREKALPEWNKGWNSMFVEVEGARLVEGVK